MAQNFTHPELTLLVARTWHKNKQDPALVSVMRVEACAVGLWWRMMVVVYGGGV